ncbi:hypothetical protein [Steroidobacter agaridevorans]|uniref:hypothetical protein n=1 Tax=Steroidobacter agaridevorans TaxID=2695856 RepID=UPI001326591C|nr:hypothetical protein [Steroidobacter agaridevorans]GFE89477.1 hypothetical protein GCM10011488_44310 [Steroidobacter agaridevorans]
METELGPIDLSGSIKGVGDFERVRAVSIEIELFGRRCRVMSIEALIRASSPAGDGLPWRHDVLLEGSIPNLESSTKRFELSRRAMPVFEAETLPSIAPIT